MRFYVRQKGDPMGDWDVCWGCNFNTRQEFLAEVVRWHQTYPQSTFTVMSHGNKGCNMNFTSAKLGDKVLVYTDDDGNVSSLHRTHYISATVIGFCSITAKHVTHVLLGWNKDNTLRPGNSFPHTDKHVPKNNSYYSYIKEVDDYIYVLWQGILSDCVKEFVGVAINDPLAEWECILPGCMKKNYVSAKTCWKCGRMPNGNEPR